MAPRKEKVAQQPRREQPTRAAKNAAKDAVPDTQPIAVPAKKAGVKKREAKSHGDAAKHKKKLKAALIKRVDEMDPEAAAAEQKALLGHLNQTASPPVTPASVIATAEAITVSTGGTQPEEKKRIRIRVIKSKAQEQAEAEAQPATPTKVRGRKKATTTTTTTKTKTTKKKKDDTTTINDAGNMELIEEFLERVRATRLVEDAQDAELRRSERWIPEYAYRPRPPCSTDPIVPHELWLVYQHLDEYIYQRTLTREEVLALPLLQDVRAYQESNGKGVQPVAPKGFVWDERFNLVPS